MQKERFIDPDSEDIVSQLAQDETGKRQYYRPVYSLHKWWARRPGALFRSIILLATESGKSLFSPRSSNSIFHLSNYFKDHNLEDFIILDPFMGGGTTLVEANRLGVKVIGCDINPVSYWIVRETLKTIDLDKLNDYFVNLERGVGEKIKSLYLTRCIHCNSEVNSLYVFWLRYAKCPSCHGSAYLFKRTLLNVGLSRNKSPSCNNPATAFCPRCFSLNNWFGEQDCVCKSCGHNFDPRKGTYDQGYFMCLNCGKKHISLVQTLKSDQKLREKMIAIEYWCNCRNERLYKSPDSFDLEKFEQIKENFESQKSHLVFPRQRILEGASSVRWRLHNYKYYFEVFNSRQLIAFNYLIEGIKEIPEEEYRNAMITIFSNSLEYNNMMTPYNFPHRKLHHLFNYHAMPLTTTPVENVVWGVGNEGAGTFVNCYKRYLNAKRYCQEPFDKFKDSQGIVHTITAKDEKISAQFVSTFHELKHTPRGTMLLCGDSANLPSIPDQSVDFVITDPPYLDSIHYSELSNFFYVWLTSLINEYPHFRSLNVPTEQEAIVNDGMDKNEQEYQKLLSSVFKECERVLKNSGKLIFTFHHTKWRAWWIVLNAIVDSGFYVIDSFPVMSEYKVNPHIRNKQALDMDLVLICQKKKQSLDFLSLSPNDILKKAMATVPSHKSNGSDNKLFLHFMGELLRSASSVSENTKIDYNWFADALTHFDDYLLELNYKNMSDNQYEISKPRQLRLLDSEDTEETSGN